MSKISRSRQIGSAIAVALASTGLATCLSLLHLAAQAKPIAHPTVKSNPNALAGSQRIGQNKQLSGHNKAEVLLLARGATLHKEGKVDEAEAVFKEVLAHNPQNVDAFFDLGAIAEGRGDLISALSNYRAALALRPGDKELKEAVNSVEKTIRRTPSAIIKVPQSGAPASTASATGNHSQTSTPEHIQSQEINFLPVSSDSPAAAVDSELSVPLNESAPRAINAKTFQLSSRKGEFVPPTLGITPDQFPDLPIGLTGKTTTSTCPPPCPPTLTVGQNQTNTGTTKFRRAAGLMLTVGAGAALNMSGLHCPICHMLNGH